MMKSGKSGGGADASRTQALSRLTLTLTPALALALTLIGRVQDPSPAEAGLRDWQEVVYEDEFEESQYNAPQLTHWSLPGGQRTFELRLHTLRKVWPYWRVLIGVSLLACPESHPPPP